MKILYVSRHFNHSGYLILQRLIAERIPIAAILLHNVRDPWRASVQGFFLRLWYRITCWYYRCLPLRTVDSEEALAKHHGIPRIYASSIKSDEFYAQLTALAPDMIVLGGGWHELIPERVYSLPPLGCINTHPSLLPAFRGTSITRWQVLHGVETSGSTIHYVDDRFDTGGALAQKAVAVGPDLAPQELFRLLGKIGADIMPDLLRTFQSTGRQPTFTTQGDERYSKYFKRWTWSEEGLRIDWSLSFREIHFFVLASTQESYKYLGPHFSLAGDRYFLRSTRLTEQHHKSLTGTPASAGAIFCEITAEGHWRLSRDNDPYVLELIKVQRFDHRYKWRRANTPVHLLPPLQDSIFAPHE